MHNTDDWDDSVILKVFHDSLKKHVTKLKESSQEEAPKQAASLTDQTTVSSNTVPRHSSGEKRKRVESVEPKASTTANKPVGFQAALNNYLSARKGITKASEKISTKPVEKEETDKTTHNVRFAEQETLHNLETVQPVVETQDHLPSAADQSSNDQHAFTSADAQHWNYYQYPTQSSQQPTSSTVVPHTLISSAMVDDALQAMLMAWYQSGYATGRYQTLCELQAQAIQAESNVETERKQN